MIFDGKTFFNISVVHITADIPHVRNWSAMYR